MGEILVKGVNRLLGVGAVLVLVAALASASAVWAQGRANAAGRRMAAGFGMGPMKMLNRLARQLDITDQQKAQIKDIVRSHKAEVKSLVDRAFDARKALRQAVTANDSRAIADAVSQLSTVERDGALLKAQLRAQIYGTVLTQDQRAKADQLMAQFEEKAEARRQRIDQFLNQF